jgi:hypothetical protein
VRSVLEVRMMAGGGGQGMECVGDGEPRVGRGYHIDDRYVWAEDAGGSDRMIGRWQVRDHVESFGVQQGAARGAGYLVVIDDHDPDRQAAVGRGIGPGRHVFRIAMRATGRIGDTASVRRGVGAGFPGPRCCRYWA